MDDKGLCFSALKGLLCGKSKPESRKKKGKKSRCGCACFGGFKHHKPIVADSSHPAEPTLISFTDTHLETQQSRAEIRSVTSTPAPTPTSNEDLLKHSTPSQSTSKTATAAAVREDQGAANSRVNASDAAEGVSSEVPASQYVSDSLESWAAVKIQSAFRGFLSRRGYIALRSLLRLQRLLQSQSVNRQTKNTLHSMQKLVKMHAQVISTRIRLLQQNQALQQAQLDQARKSPEEHEEEWDNSTLTKEERDARLQSKLEATIKRERSLAYAFSHKLWKNPPKSIQRMVMEMDAESPQWEWNWLDRWMATRPWDSNIPFAFDSEEFSQKRLHELTMARNQISIQQQTQAQAQAQAQAQPQPQPQHKKLPSFGDEVKQRILISEKPQISVSASVSESATASVSGSKLPHYMLPTESARAKVRSRSNPKSRPSWNSNINKRHSYPLSSEVSSGSSLRSVIIESSSQMPPSRTRTASTSASASASKPNFK